MQPLVSIITVSYNAVQTIEKTIESVLQQNYPNIEYIIIDGGSTDGTVDIINKYADRIAYWCSESDNGIYDAMNKGIQHVSGRYVFFLGADDLLFDANVFQRIEPLLNRKDAAAILSGRVVAVEPSGVQILAGSVTSKWAIKTGVMLPHQGLLIQSNVIRQYRFNANMRIYADYEQLLRMVMQNIKIQYTPEIIAYYTLNGASTTTGDKYLQEKMETITEQCGNWYVFVFRMRVIKSQLMNIVKSTLRTVGLYSLVRKIVYCTKGNR